MKMKEFNSKEKVIFSIAALVILILSYSTVLDAISEKTIDISGEKYINETLKKAAYTYGIARISNGLISVIQSIELNVTPGGLGTTIGIGEALDPINDLIERFSVVMLFCTTSLGIQKILMEIGVWLGFKFLLTLSMIFLMIGIWIPKFTKINFMNLGFKLILISMVVRFCIPVVGLVGNQIDNLFLNDKYNESSQSLKVMNQELNELKSIMDQSKANNIQDEDIKEQNGAATEQNEDAEKGYFDKLKHTYQGMDLKKYMKGGLVGFLLTSSPIAKLNEIKARFALAIGHLIDLMVIFIIQTIILPLLVLWLLKKFVGYIAGDSISSLIEQKVKGAIEKVHGLGRKSQESHS
jgi:cell division protein FtsL